MTDEPDDETPDEPSLATVAATDALAACFENVTGLPSTVRRNDLRLAGFAASGADDIGWLLALADDDWENSASPYGGGRELGVGVELLFAVEGEPGEDRDTVFNAGIAAIRDVLFPPPDRLPLTVPGKFEDLALAGAIERHRFSAEGGAAPVEAIRVRLTLLVTAPTPFG